LANTVDTALQEFNISMGQSNLKTSITLFSGTPPCWPIRGENKAKMLKEFGTLTNKYGAQPGACDTAFKATCPWDSASLTSTFMKLMDGLTPGYADFNLFFFRKVKERVWRSWL
jgi:hypothetical protein